MPSFFQEEAKISFQRLIIRYIRNLINTKADQNSVVFTANGNWTSKNGSCEFFKPISAFVRPTSIELIEITEAIASVCLLIATALITYLTIDSSDSNEGKQRFCHC